MTTTAGSPRPRVRRARFFATTAPGLSRMLRRELAQADGTECTGTGFDGRADIVFFEADRDGRAAALSSRLAEDVFAETGRASRTATGSPAAVAAAAWPADGVQRALSVWAEQVRPLTRSMSFRVVTRVLSESRFRRTDLRQAMTGAIARDKPRWTTAEPASLEIWISEWHDGQYAAGLRLSGAERRQGGQRAGALLPGALLPGALLPGALRPSVAAAMVSLAGPPRRRGAVLLDPCCGPGVVLAEALAAGWSAEGTDTDPGAVAAAAVRAAGASVQLGDARELLQPDDSVGACVSALHSGLPLTGPGDEADWVADVLAEMSRVTRSGGSVVVLAPDLPRLPGPLRLRKQVPVRLPALPGSAPSIWYFHRA